MFAVELSKPASTSAIWMKRNGRFSVIQTNGRDKQCFYYEMVHVSWMVVAIQKRQLTKIKWQNDRNTFQAADLNEMVWLSSLL